MSRYSTRRGPRAPENEAEIQVFIRTPCHGGNLCFRLAMRGLRPAGNRAQQMLFSEKATNIQLVLEKQKFVPIT